ncbi:MAG: YibE/F family protein, partial [Cetobacterium sp.]
MKKVLLSFFILLISFVSYSQEEYIKGKVLKLEKIESPGDDVEDIKEIKIFNVKILEGESKGKEIYLEFPVYSEESYNLDIEEGMSVVLYEEYLEDGTSSFYIADIDKRNYIFILTGIFIALTVLFAKKKGLKAIIALSLVIFFIYKGFLPGIIAGYSPIILSTITALFASFITIYLMTGFTEKGIVAIFGSVLGVLAAGILSFVFTNLMGLTGYTSVEALNYAPLLKGIDVKEIISAGVILGSMGAVMDVAMSISSALEELKERDNSISKKELFYSGMRIGSDV